jgi:FtsZ-binding cell division protein ZapB
VNKTSVSTLPSLLLERIEEVKTDIKILKREKNEAQREADRLRDETVKTQRSLTR